jgi:hypothetical protein
MLSRQGLGSKIGCSWTGMPQRARARWRTAQLIQQPIGFQHCTILLDPRSFHAFLRRTGKGLRGESFQFGCMVVRILFVEEFITTHTFESGVQYARLGRTGTAKIVIECFKSRERQLGKGSVHGTSRSKRSDRRSSFESTPILHVFFTDSNVPPFLVQCPQSAFCCFLS